MGTSRTQLWGRYHPYWMQTLQFGCFTVFHVSLTTHWFLRVSSGCIISWFVVGTLGGGGRHYLHLLEGRNCSNKPQHPFSFNRTVSKSFRLALSLSSIIGRSFTCDPSAQASSSHEPLDRSNVTRKDLVCLSFRELCPSWQGRLAVCSSGDGQESEKAQILGL